MFNEKPAADDILAAEEAGEGGGELPRGAVLHTTKGDVHLKLFPDECPKTVENFATHARSGYYDGVIFHRVIKGFMVQTGDPLGGPLHRLLLFMRTAAWIQGCAEQAPGSMHAGQGCTCCSVHDVHMADRVPGACRACGAP